MLCSKYGIDNEEAYKRGKHTWQAGHGGTHSCKIYKPLRDAGAYKSLVWATAPNPFNADFICGYASFRR